MRVWFLVHGWGALQSWYQSRTDCRKPLLLADVESSVCENYFETYKLFMKTLSRLLLLLTWYRSDSESPYLVLISKVLLSLLVFQNLGPSWVDPF